MWSLTAKLWDAVFNILAIVGMGCMILIGVMAMSGLVFATYELSERLIREALDNRRRSQNRCKVLKERESEALAGGK